MGYLVRYIPEIIQHANPKSLHVIRGSRTISDDILFLQGQIRNMTQKSHGSNARLQERGLTLNNGNARSVFLKLHFLLDILPAGFAECPVRSRLFVQATTNTKLQRFGSFMHGPSQFCDGLSQRFPHCFTTFPHCYPLRATTRRACPWAMDNLHQFLVDKNLGQANS